MIFYTNEHTQFTYYSLYRAMIESMENDIIRVYQDDILWYSLIVY